MASPGEIADRLRAALSARPEVQEAYLFGSLARGDAAPHSDVDVAVYADPLPDTPFGYDADLAAELMRRLGTSQVDVVLLNRAPPLLYHRVLKDGIRLFARDLRAATVRAGRALSRYCDYLPQLAKIDAAAALRARRGGFGRSPGQLDPAVIRRHLFALDAAVTRLRAHAGKPVDALRGDLDELWAVERGLQLCAQNCIDLATHLAASAGHDVADYASAIDRLAALGVLPAAFAARFRAIAGLRDILVHGYLQVDVDRLHGLLNARLDDFVELAAHVEAHLRPASPTG